MRDGPFLFRAMSPVGEGPVRTPEVWSLQCSSRQRSGGPSVDIDAEPGDLPRDRSSALDAGELNEDAIEVRPRPVVVLLLDAEGGAGGVEVRAGRRHHRAEGVVGGGPDEVP